MIVDQKVNKSFVGVFLIDNDINGTQLAVSKKPTLIKRLIFYYLLGWKWVDVKKLKKNDIR